MCLGVGLAGGVVGPTLAIGAVGGVAYAAAAGAAGLYSGPVFAPAVCGMMAFTAPVIGAPLAGILFVFGIVGRQLSADFVGDIGGGAFIAGGQRLRPRLLL